MGGILGKSTPIGSKLHKIDPIGTRISAAAEKKAGLDKMGFSVWQDAYEPPPPVYDTSVPGTKTVDPGHERRTAELGEGVRQRRRRRVTGDDDTIAGSGASIDSFG